MTMRKIESTHSRDGVQNLLDTVVPAHPAEANIHTFGEFKEWLSNSFKINHQLNSASYIKKNEMVRSLRLKQAKSLNYDMKIDNTNLTSSVKRRPSFQTLDLIQEGREALESSNNRSRKNSQQLGFELPELKELSIKESKSAHSSRSFRGFEQINQYELTKLLGRGAFSEVYMGIDVQSSEKTKYAVKVIEGKQLKRKYLRRRVSLEGSQQNTVGQQKLPHKLVRNQIAILKKMSHQYVIKLHQVIVDDQTDRVYLILEYYGGGFINQNRDRKGQYRRLLESECRRYFKQLALALDYIHNVVKIAHRDIKPENILLSDYDQIRLNDFGLGTQLTLPSHASGTRLYMPPEQGGNPQAADIWALGVTLLVLLTGHHPQFDGHIIELPKLIQSLKDVSEQCKDFLQRCLQTDASKRMRADQMLGHPWIGMGEFDLMRSSQNQSYDITITSADEQNAFKTKQKDKTKSPKRS